MRLHFGSGFLDVTPKAQVTEEKSRQIELCENFKILSIKKHYNRVKRQPIEWEKISVYHISGKGLVSRLYRELLKLNNKKPNNLMQMGRRLE